MTEINHISRIALFEAIGPEVSEAYDRHISQSGRKTISLDPYALVPLEKYESLQDEYNTHVKKWADYGIDIHQVIKSTLLVDAATEENLPHYTAEIEAGFELWHEWNRIWTTEERSHGEVMVRDIEARKIMNMSTEWFPVREQNLVTGIHSKVDTPADGIAYVATQELLTKVAHFQSARLMDSSGSKTLRALGSDEGRHYQFYISALKAVSRVDPDMVLVAMRRQHEGNNFAMPGEKGIPNYNVLAKTIALSGVFDAITILEAQKKTIDDAGLLDVDPKTDEGKAAQEWANAISSKDDRSWTRKQKLMDILRERAVSEISSTLLPFILGQTVELENNSFIPIKGK